MEATELEAFTDRLVDDLGDRRPGGHGGSEDDENCATGLAWLVQAQGVVDDRSLLALMSATVRLRNVVDGLLARITAVADEAGVARRKRLKTGADLLAGFGVAPGAAWRAARVGREIAGLPGLDVQLRNGFVSIEQADAVVKGIALITSRVDLDDRVRGELAARLEVQANPAAVAKRAREIAIELTPAGAPADGDSDRLPVAERSELNAMMLTQTGEGRVEASLDLDVVSGEALITALDPLMRPVLEPDGSPDTRSAARRRADALGQVIRSYLAGSERPRSGGQLPHVSLVLPLASRRDSGQATGAENGTAAGHEASEACGVPGAALGWTGPVSVATADLIACDAQIRAFLVDAERVPLSIGRDERLVPPGIRRGLEVRDGGCAMPGCGRPASWCDAHHIRPWSEGGETSLTNGVLLCRMHHTMIHHTGWEVIMGRDGHPWFTPPADPATGRRPEPMRSHSRRTLTELPRAS